MIFHVYGTVYSGAELASKVAETDNQLTENRAAYARVFNEGNFEFDDPNTTGDRVIFNVREANDSAAVVVVAIEEMGSVVAVLLSGINAAADKSLVDDVRQKAFKDGGEPEHEAVHIEAPVCYAIIRDIGHGGVVPDAVIGGLVDGFRRSGLLGWLTSSECPPTHLDEEGS